jgi:RNA ligase
MNLYDLIDRDNLERGIADKLINIREAHDGQRIYNYTDGAMYTPGAWDNPAVRQCRGLIVDPDDFVVARPWAKFFNHGQAEAGALDMGARVEVTDKMDGSLGIIHIDESGSLRVSTRGSFESEQAFHATDWLTERRWALADVDRYTPLVEIIYPGNRIVCDYGDRDELVLLGAVDIETGEYHGPAGAARLCGWPGALADDFPYGTLRDALAAPPRPGAEGLCVRYLDRPHIVKIKQDDYVALHRIVTGLSERTVWQHIVDGGELSELLAPLPDELHEWTRGVWDRIHGDALGVASRVVTTHAYILDRLPDGWQRRAYAEKAKAEGALAPYLFQMLDGRNPLPSILHTLKPAGDTRARPTSEAVA